MPVDSDSPGAGHVANFLYQVHRGHLIVHIAGRQYLLNTGAPSSVGYEPICIAGHTFTVQESHGGVSAGHLTDSIGITVEGMIGADVLRHFNLGIYSNERIVQFSQLRPAGDILLPLQEYRGIPILHLGVGDRVRRLFLDTGSPLSYLMPHCLTGLAAQGREESFYPLLGEFLTNVYVLNVGVAGASCTLRFGELPEALRPMLEAGAVEGILGTELLQHVAINFSMLDRMLCLELPHSDFGLAAG